MSESSDSSRTIVIDEIIVMSERSSIQAAQRKLSEARKLLDPGKLADDRMFGATRDVLGELLEKICKELRDRETRCDEILNIINREFTTFRDIDIKQSNQIRGS